MSIDTAALTNGLVTSIMLLCSQLLVFALDYYPHLFLSPFGHIIQDATAQSSTQNGPPSGFIEILDPSPSGAITIHKPRTVTPFEIDDSVYAVITGDGNSSTLLSIANITNPNSPSVTSYSNTSSGLGNIFYSHVFTINGSTYVIVSGNAADNIGIINITNPLSPVHLVTISDDEHTKLNNPRGITTTTIGSSTYALVTTFVGDGVQIINVTDPSNPSAVSNIKDRVDGYEELDGASSITTTTIGSSTYALVTAFVDDGVQIINITNPAIPSPVANITDGDDYPILNGSRAITTVTLDSFTYALVAAFDDNGTQIINITNPAIPSPVANITDGDDYPILNGSRAITTVTLDSFTYALVTAFNDNGIQIINITNPASPSPAANITYDATDYAKLRGPYGISTTTINSSIYALVASYNAGLQIVKISSITAIPDKTAPNITSSATINPRLISVDFDEPIQIAQGAHESISITSSSTVFLIDELSIRNETTLEISLLSSLKSNATPQIVFNTTNPSAPIITDLAGNALENVTVTALDKIPPSIKSAMQISSSLIVVDFDEPIFTPALGGFHPRPTVNMRSQDPSLINGSNTLEISGTFPAHAILNISIPGANIMDAAGNNFTRGSILTNNTFNLFPYTISELEIIVPYNNTIDLNTLSASDYTVSFAPGQTSPISAVTLSSDATEVIITMNTPFGTDATPTIEQTGEILNTNGKNISIGKITAEDRAPPNLVSAISSSSSSIKVTFSEKMAPSFTAVDRYDVSGATVISTHPSHDSKSIILNTSLFVRASIQIDTLIEDANQNKLPPVTTSVIKN